MDKEIIKAAYEAICKEMCGRMGKKFDPEASDETGGKSEEPGIADIVLGKGKDEEPAVELEQQSSEEEDGSPDLKAILEAAAKVARKK